MNTQKYSAEALANATQTTRRTIRYYVQSGLIPAPEGSGKGARYGAIHLERLIKIKRLKAEGFSLGRISQLLDKPAETSSSPQAGQLQVVSRIAVAKGVVIEIDAEQAGLTNEQLRQFMRQTLQCLESTKKGKNNDRVTS